MKRLLLSGILLLSVMVSASGSFGADYQKGFDAFQRGDTATALREWEPLAKQGNARAQHNLGWVYRKGLGVTQNYETALKWYKLAADQGNASAQHNLGFMYHQGEGVPQNDKTAVKWYRLAADQGHAIAQNNLGVMYSEGKGVHQDNVEAMKWFRFSANQGYPDAVKNLEQVESQSTSTQITEAQRRFDEWSTTLLNKRAEVAQEVTPTVTAKKIPKIKPKRNAPQAPSIIGTSEKTPKIKPKPAKQVAKKTPQPKTLQFKKVPKRPDDIAVIIANSNYKKLGKGIPNVTPAYTDAEGIKRYFMNAKGVREGNIIYLKDATGTQMMSVFGTKDDHKGKLFNWTKPNVSKVYVYYAGHGAPAGDKGTTYLVPSDADSETVQLTGYPLKQLYRNLGKIPATSITVILEACFSGQSQGGYLSRRISGISVVPKMPLVPSKITVISAGAANQVATWEEDESQSLFTKYFLKGMSGEGDKPPYGNGDGKVTYKELGKYLEGTMTYFARRYYGRDQKAQIVRGG